MLAHQSLSFAGPQYQTPPVTRLGCHCPQPNDARVFVWRHTEADGLDNWTSRAEQSAARDGSMFTKCAREAVHDRPHKIGEKRALASFNKNVGRHAG
jgi:hypothetical protein